MAAVKDDVQEASQEEHERLLPFVLERAQKAKTDGISMGQAWIDHPILTAEVERLRDETAWLHRELEASRDRLVFYMEQSKDLLGWLIEGVSGDELPRRIRSASWYRPYVAPNEDLQALVRGVSELIERDTDREE